MTLSNWWLQSFFMGFCIYNLSQFHHTFVERIEHSEMLHKLQSISIHVVPNMFYVFIFIFFEWIYISFYFLFFNLRFVLDFTYIFSKVLFLLDGCLEQSKRGGGCWRGRTTCLPFATNSICLFHHMQMSGVPRTPLPQPRVYSLFSVLLFLDCSGNERWRFWTRKRSEYLRVALLYRFVCVYVAADDSLKLSRRLQTSKTPKGFS